MDTLTWINLWCTCGVALGCRTALGGNCWYPRPPSGLRFYLVSLCFKNECDSTRVRAPGPEPEPRAWDVAPATCLDAGR